MKMEVTNYRVVNSHSIKWQWVGMKEYNSRKSFLEPSAESGNRAKCSGKKVVDIDCRQNKIMDKAESIVHSGNHCK